MKRAEEIANITGGQLVGDPEKMISGVASVMDCREDEITFATEEKFILRAEENRIGAIFLSEKRDGFPHIQIIVPDPKIAAFQTANSFIDKEPFESGISDLAFVDSSAKVSFKATVMPFAFIGPLAQVGKGTVIYPGVYIGSKALIGNHCVLFPNSVVGERCVLGNRVILNNCASIGADGFGYYPDPNGVHQKIPQLGIVKIENNVEVGACSCIDRATFGRTTIGKGTKIDNLVQVAHNCVIGENGMMVSQVGLAGSTEIEKNVTFAARSACAGHLKVGKGAIIGAMAAVANDIKSGEKVGGIPARNHIDWKRSLVATEQLPKSLRKLRRLEKKVAALEAELRHMKKKP